MSKEYLGPYINFQGKAREAMEFYHGVLGGKLGLNTLDAKGAPKEAGPGDRITFARLQTDSVVITGSDGHPSYPAKMGDAMAIYLNGADKARLTKVFNGLAEGGTVKGPISPQPWGADVGRLMDKYGINWVVSIEKA